MGPYGKTTRTLTRSTSRKYTRKLGFGPKNNGQQKKKTNEEVQVTCTTSNSSTTEGDFPKTQGTVFEAIIDHNNDNNNSSEMSSGCSTPKGQRFRIPEIATCPPAPKKRRVGNDDDANTPASSCSVRRSPAAFFAPPDLELFFYYALRGISV